MDVEDVGGAEEACGEAIGAVLLDADVGYQRAVVIVDGDSHRAPHDALGGVAHADETSCFLAYDRQDSFVTGIEVVEGFKTAWLSVRGLLFVGLDQPFRGFLHGGVADVGG